MNELYGINIIEYKKFLVLIGSSMVGSSDSAVRKASLDLLAQYYMKLGTQLYVILGKNQLGAAGDQLSDKCMSLIDERLKRVKVCDDTNTQSAELNRPKTPTRSKQTNSISPDNTPVSKRTTQANQHSALKRPASINHKLVTAQPGEEIYNPIHSVNNNNTMSYDSSSANNVPSCFSLDVGGRQLGARVSINNSNNRMSRRFEPSASPTSSLSYQSDYPAPITSSSYNSPPINNTIAQSIQQQINSGIAPDDALKQFWQQLIDNADRSWLLGQADSLVELCIIQVEQSFTYDNTDQLQIQHRRATGSINILSELFKSTTLPNQVSVQTVEKSLQVFIPLLLNEQFRKSTNNDTKQLLQQCNKFILKFVTDCDPTTSIVALIQQIKQQTYQAIQQGGTEQNPPSNKPLIDLLIKCELKTARAVDPNKLHIDQLLSAIHEYYELCGLDKDSLQPNPAELAARKLMRTLLQTLIIHKGNAVISLLPHTADMNSIIRRYTERILLEINSGGSADNVSSPARIISTTRTEPTTATAQHLHASGVSSIDDDITVLPNNNTTSDNSNDADYLRELLKNTTDVNQSQLSFQKLSDYMQQHPTVDIYQYASGISESFQQHIKRTLQRMMGSTTAPTSSQSIHTTSTTSSGSLAAPVPVSRTSSAPLRRPSTAGGTTVDDIRRRLAQMQMNTLRQPVNTSSNTNTITQPISAPTAVTLLSAASIPIPTAASASITATSTAPNTSRMTATTLEAIKQRLAASQGRSTLTSAIAPTADIITGATNKVISAPITQSIQPPIVSPLSNVINTLPSSTPVNKSVDLASIKARLNAVRAQTSALTQSVNAAPAAQP